MLLCLGIVTADPKCDPGVIGTLQPVKSKQDIFGSCDEKRIQLEKLLKSKNPHDHKVGSIIL